MGDDIMYVYGLCYSTISLSNDPMLELNTIIQKTKMPII